MFFYGKRGCSIRGQERPQVHKWDKWSILVMKKNQFVTCICSYIEYTWGHQVTCAEFGDLRGDLEKGNYEVTKPVYGQQPGLEPVGGNLTATAHRNSFREGLGGARSAGLRSPTTAATSHPTADPCRCPPRLARGARGEKFLHRNLMTCIC